MLINTCKNINKYLYGAGEDQQDAHSQDYRHLLRRWLDEYWKIQKIFKNTCKSIENNCKNIDKYLQKYW